MTPLANALTKNAVFCKSHINLLAEAHFFEVSELLNTVEQFGRCLQTMEETDRLIAFNQRTFLPAPTTWIEFDHRPFRWIDHPSLRRVAIVLVQRPEDEGWADAYFCSMADDEPLFCGLGFLAIAGDDYYTPPAHYYDFLHSIERRSLYLSCAHQFLAMINTPRIFGRRQHLPLRRQEERVANALGIQGRFPLRGWTELKLEVTVPKDMRWDGLKEAHLTGKKALHFCRAHLRFRNGAFEFVRSHWRGDASLGMKRTRYKVVPPRTAA